MERPARYDQLAKSPEPTRLSERLERIAALQQDAARSLMQIAEHVGIPPLPQAGNGAASQSSRTATIIVADLEQFADGIARLAQEIVQRL